MYVGGVGGSFLMCLVELAFHCIAGNNGQSITQVNISDYKRQILREKSLPDDWLSSEHPVTYLYAGQQIRTYQIKKFGLYCNDSSSAESLTTTLGDTITIAIPDVFKTSSYTTSWYKDCKEYVKNTSELLFTSVQLSDSAVYTYIIYMYNGKNYSICGKKLLIVEARKKENQMTKAIARLKRQLQGGHRETIKPRIFGVGSVTEEEVEIGKNHVIKCEALVINRKESQLYWLINKNMTDDSTDFVDECTPIKDKTCYVKDDIDSQDHIMHAELHIVNVDEEDIKYPYQCKLDSLQGGDIRQFVLKLKKKSQDISKNVFTASIIASTTCSTFIVLLICLCLLFRIQIVLFYRSITGIDETIGDGKEYDAYLSFRGDSTYESEERQFAFETLVPILEDCFGYKLFIFERDVVPGGALVDDMNSFLEKSRRLIIVLSKGFTSCKTTYELESGLHKAMVEKKIKVIVIEFTPLSEQSFQPESLQLLKTKSRVRWKGVKSCPLNSQFWTKVQYLMPAKPLKSSKSFPVLEAM